MAWEDSAGCDGSLLLNVPQAGGIRVDPGGIIQSVGFSGSGIFPVLY